MGALFNKIWPECINMCENGDARSGTQGIGRFISCYDPSGRALLLSLRNTLAKRDIEQQLTQLLRQYSAMTIPTMAPSTKLIATPFELYFREIKTQLKANGEWPTTEDMKVAPRRPYSYTMPDWSIAIGNETITRARVEGRTMRITAYVEYKCQTLNVAMKPISSKVETLMMKLPYPYVMEIEHTSTQKLEPSPTMSEIRTLEKELKNKLWLQGWGSTPATASTAPEAASASTTAAAATAPAAAVKMGGKKGGTKGKQ